MWCSLGGKLMTSFSAKDYFEQQYVLRKSLPSFMEHVAEWEALSTDENFTHMAHEVIKFGDHPRQTFELFKATSQEPAQKLAIFIHGGFWRAMDRKQSRFLAHPFVENGYDCVIAEYRLMPEFSLGELVDDTANMLLCLQELGAQYNLSDEMLLSGHSAGAHLAAFGLKQAVQRGLKYKRCSLLYFSGVFDIYPVSVTSIGDELEMPKEDVARWSVYSGGADNGIQPLFVVGDDETDDFKRQSIVGAQHMGNPEMSNITYVPKANHLTLMTKFAADKNLTKTILEQLGEIDKKI